MSLVAPEDILEFWIGESAQSSEALKEKSALWFRKSDETDQIIRARFGETVEALASGLAKDWSAQGARDRLAAIIALDQFSRNIYRGSALSFANDSLALSLAMQTIEAGEHLSFSPVEQAFLYLPLEHAEDVNMQAKCVALFEQLAISAPAAFKEACENWLDFARRHKAVIDQFGRFPHRNGIFGRASTPDELEYLAQPGSGF